jgi:signal transduction histidine kinase
MVARCLRHLIKLHPRLSSRDRRLYGQRNDQEESGLGTSLVKALAQQLGAQVVIVNNPTGVSVSITHATFNARVSHAA